MIRNNQFLFQRIILKRTYTHAEWATKRDEYIQEARDTANAKRPAKVLLYRREGNGVRELMATIVSH